MNNLIEIKLSVTPVQLSAIAQLLTDGVPGVIVEKPVITAEETPATTQADAGSLFAESDAQIAAGTAGNGQQQDATTQAATQEQKAAGAPAATEVPPPPPGDVELGKGLNGQMIPWDARIHGKAKKKNADGTWRLIQGVDRETLVPQVEAELVQAMAASPNVAAPAADAALNTATQSTAAPATTEVPPPPAATTEVPPPPAATQQTAATEVPPPPAGKPTNFAELLPRVTTAKANGTLTDEKIAECCAALGLPNFGMIATRPDLIESAAEILGV